MSRDNENPFADIKPEDFARRSKHFYEHAPGPETFEVFVGRHLYSVRYGYLASGGRGHPVVALSDGRVERLFGATPTETLQEFLGRMQALATETGSTRFFFSRLIPLAVARPGAAQMGEDDADWQESMLWFGMDRAEGQQMGSMAVIDAASLGENQPFDGLGGLMEEWLTAVLR